MFKDSLIGCLILSLFIGFVGLSVLSDFVKYSSIGEGNHNGYITAVDERGYIWPNYEVYFKTDNSSSQEDVYCVSRNNKELVENLRLLSSEKQNVMITYRGVRGIGLGLCHLPEIVEVNY